MGKCFRHFKALMRKNWIVWYRNPGCASFEILAPLVLMVVLWIIRLQVPVTATDKNGILNKKFPVYLGARPVEGKGRYGHFDYDNSWNSDILRPMIEYANYSNRRVPDPSDFNIGNDLWGP